jgi:hypothetical protein
MAGMDVPEIHEDHWHWRDDDGDESSTGATFLVAEDTTIIFAQDQLDINLRLRFSMHVTLVGIAGGGNGWQLQYDRNSDGFLDVTDASSVVRSSASANLTNNEDTTEHGVTFVGAGPFTADNDAVDEVDGKTPNKSFALDEYWAVEYCFQLRELDLSDADSIEFRIVDKGGSVMFAYPSPHANCTIEIDAPFAHSTYLKRYQEIVAPAPHLRM